jgi:hypothetical protein
MGEDDMGVSTLDGTLEAANLKHEGRGVSFFDSIRIRRSDGGVEDLGKTAVAPNLAELLKPGAAGRFYFYSSIDHKGLHGLRLADGASAYGFPPNNERIMLMMMVVMVAWLATGLLQDGSVRIIPVTLFAFGAIVFTLFRKTRMESRRQFDGDASFAAAAPAV